jgi:hypothetical protein
LYRDVQRSGLCVSTGHDRIGAFGHDSVRKDFLRLDVRVRSFGDFLYYLRTKLIKKKRKSAKRRCGAQIFKIRRAFWQSLSLSGSWAMNFLSANPWTVFACWLRYRFFRQSDCRKKLSDRTDCPFAHFLPACFLSSGSSAVTCARLAPIFSVILCPRFFHKKETRQLQ